MTVGVAEGHSTLGAMITADSQPMSAAPLDGTPIRLFVSAGSVIASFWSEERCQKTFGTGCYRAGWYLLDDDTKELDDPLGWEPLVHGHACSDAWAKIDASEWLAGFPALDYGWLVKGEYLSVDFGNFNTITGCPRIGPDCSAGAATNLNVTLRDHVWRAGMNYKF